MKYSLSIYSLSREVKKGNLDWFSVMDKAKEIGFDGVEFIESAFTDKKPCIEEAKEYREYAEKIGIEIANLAVPADVLNDETAYDTLCKWVDMAEVLGCKTMRHDITGGIKNRTYQGYGDIVKKAADVCRKVTEYAKQKGIKTMSENHGYFSQDSDRVEMLVNTVASDNFGLLLDMGNFLCADENPSVAFGRCAPYAFYVHAKDFIVKSGSDTNPGNSFFVSRGGNYLRGTIVGHGNVPVKACLLALKKVNYDGWISIEFEGLEDPCQAVSLGLENLKRYVNEVY